jgi:apolipoprotein N-acyltransferase
MKAVLNNLGVCILTGIFFLLAWNPIGIVPLIFIALLPLLFLHYKHINSKNRVYFLWMFIAFLCLNITTTWWVWNSSSWGALAMLLLNALFMTIPFVLSRWVQKRTTAYIGQIGLVVFWLSFEYVHLRWDGSWPWLNLGNVFSDFTQFVQWYEYTGIFGGSLLVLLVNLFIWNGIYDKKKGFLHATFAMLSVLFLWSYYLGNSDKIKTTDAIDVVCIQPNYDAYTEKFTLPPSQMLDEMITLSQTEVDENTDVLVWPETSLVDNVDVNKPQLDYQIQRLRVWKRKYPNLSIFTGANAQKLYRGIYKKPEMAARNFGRPNSGIWWVFYNASFLLTGDSVYVYHKSKLVPGTEILPFMGTFPFLEKLAVSLDEHSASGTLGTSGHYKPPMAGKHKMVPAICYESIYGEHVANFVNNGAEYISVITNDAWWGNTPGYKQHLSYSKLRAIETRKWVARSANTGISAFINPHGEIVKKSAWQEKIAIKHKIYTNTLKTFYTRHGDYIGRAAVLGSILLSLLCLVPKDLRGKRL